MSRRDRSSESPPRRPPRRGGGGSSSSDEDDRRDSRKSPPRRNRDSRDRREGHNSSSSNSQRHGDSRSHRHHSEKDEERRRDRSRDRSSRDQTTRSRPEGSSSVAQPRDSTKDEKQPRKRSSSPPPPAPTYGAGLQSGADFGEVTRRMKADRDAAMNGITGDLSGQNAETIYRNRSGAKVDKVTEYIKEEALKKGAKLKLEQAQYEWGKGAVQKQEAVDARRELEEIANEPFARTVEDSKLENMRKEAIRDGDPMAEYFQQKIEKRADESSAQSANSHGVQRTVAVVKPVYRGPPPPPNRFGIKPGYRWDGVVRGINYEAKILNKTAAKQASREEEYQWSVQDM